MKRFIYSLLAFFMIIAISYAGSQQTSSTTATTIITHARYYLNEASADWWDDDELLVYLNQGQVDIAARSRAMEGTESINLVADTHEYAITSNYIDVAKVVYKDANSDEIGLDGSELEGTGHNFRSTGRPAYWYEWGGNVGVYPMLDDIDDTTPETITIYYVKRPISVASGEAVTVPAYYDKALTLYIVGEALKKKGRYADAAAIKGDYMTEIDRYRKDFNEMPDK